MKESHSYDRDPELFQKVKEAVNMSQVAEYYGIKINRKGLCKCPFHNDTNPSLKIYPNEKGFYCFTCGAGGDQIKFAALYRGIRNEEAAKELAAAFQIPIQIPVTYREKREAALRQRRRREKAVFLSQARNMLMRYRGRLCEAIRERNEHFFEALDKLTYVEYLIDCLEQCPDELYADKKAVKRVGEIERRLAGWDNGTFPDRTVSG